MPSVHKFAANFAKALKQVLERGCERCTSDIKKEASQCLLWRIHINTCIEAASQDVATPHLKKLLAYALAYDPDLRTFGVRANMAQPMIDGLQTQLTAIITGRWDIITAFHQKDPPSKLKKWLEVLVKCSDSQK